MKQYYKYFSFLPVIIMMTVIFHMSNQPATQSSKSSLKIVDTMLELIQTVRDVEWSPEEYEKWSEFIHTPIRKFAHMAEYAVLALTVLFPFLVFQVKGKKKLIYTFFISVAYAMTDEFHQLFIPGRSGEIKDVCIDAIGILMGCLFYCFIAYFYSKFRKRGTSVVLCK